MRGDSDAARLIRGDPERPISIITLMELVQGARSQSEAQTIRSLLREHDLDVIPINEAISYVAAEFIDAYSHSAELRLPDALMAATAHHCGQTLATANVRHFRVIRDLKIKPFRPAGLRN